MIHDPQSIIVYPDRARLFGYALVYLVAEALMTLPFLANAKAVFSPYRATHPVETVFAACFGALVAVLMLLLALLLVFTLYRILVRKPSIIVNSDGIVDGCSLIAGGKGLIRWDEILAIMLYAYNKRTVYLGVIPRDEQALFLRSSPLARLFQRSITLTLAKGANLPQWLLSKSVNDIAAEIQWQYGAFLTFHTIALLDLLQRE